LEREPGLFSRVRVYFIGTSYAADGKGKKTVEPVALLSGVEDHVTEITDRLPYFTALKVLKDSDILIIPGSTDTQYTASKLYPYILAARPILAVFNENSSVVEILSKTKAGICVTFRNEDSTEKIGSEFYHACTTMLHDLPRTPSTAWDAFEPYTAREATRKQVDFFNKILVQ
jgi:hypothetical protein